MSDRRILQLEGNARPVAHEFRCRVKGCRKLVGVHDMGWPLPCCKPHAERLPAKLYDDVSEAAEGSPFDPAAVLAAALVVVKVQAFFAPVARKRKAKRKHA